MPPKRRKPESPGEKSPRLKGKSKAGKASKGKRAATVARDVARGRKRMEDGEKFQKTRQVTQLQNTGAHASTIAAIASTRTIPGAQGDAMPSPPTPRAREPFGADIQMTPAPPPPIATTQTGSVSEPRSRTVERNFESQRIVSLPPPVQPATLGGGSGGGGPVNRFAFNEAPEFNRVNPVGRRLRDPRPTKFRRTEDEGEDRRRVIKENLKRELGKMKQEGAAAPPASTGPPPPSSSFGARGAGTVTGAVAAGAAAAAGIASRGRGGGAKSKALVSVKKAENKRVQGRQYQEVRRRNAPTTQRISADGNVNGTPMDISAPPRASAKKRRAPAAIGPGPSKRKAPAAPLALPPGGGNDDVALMKRRFAGAAHQQSEQAAFRAHERNVVFGTAATSVLPEGVDPALVAKFAEVPKPLRPRTGGDVVAATLRSLS